jgi:hypothetical protein
MARRTLSLGLVLLPKIKIPPLPLKKIKECFATG